jgi:hypothetical protein
MPPPIRRRAPAWRPDRSDYLILWHGCTAFDKDDIEVNGIDLAKCRVDTDFGRGFYLTTRERQARDLAWTRYYDWRADPANAGQGGNQPALLRFRVRRYTAAGRAGPLDDGLDQLRSLCFVLDDEDFWSFVHHCRQSVPANPARGKAAVVHDHKRPPGGWYDVVIGPVAARWQQRRPLPGADQVSFHTPEAIAILDALIVSGLAGNREHYRWDPAP